MLGQRFEAGQFITFSYNPPPPVPPKPRPARYVKRRLPDGRVVQELVPAKAAPPPPPPRDPAKEVFVLHPNFRNQMHAIDMKRLTPAEGQIVKAFMDPAVKAAVDAGQWPVPNAPNYSLLRDILRRTDPTELIKQPMAFYAQLVKPFIRQSDAYRRYDPRFISNVRVVQESKVVGHVTNAAPLFKKV